MLKPDQPYVLLHHKISDKEHWDLCLDLGEVLATWRVLSDPRVRPDKTDAGWPAQRIQDHRRAFLEYEGPLSGDRGDVRRVDRGVWGSIEQGPAGWVVRLEGEVLRGVYRLPAEAGPGEMLQIGLGESSEDGPGRPPA